MQRETVTAADMELPYCPCPKPGEEVTWFQDALQLHGILIGHTPDGRPCIHNNFGRQSIVDSFDHIRLKDPFNRIKPNWSSLPLNSLLRPTKEEINRLDKLLRQTTPPGPQYIELVKEIWMRGYEVFVVGGTVRDILCGKETKDVDLVTSIPLVKVMPLVETMYRNGKLEKHAKINGHLRLGGSEFSMDPFIDLTVFKHSLPGTKDAIFSSNFTYDVKHRDFACNSVYYDPINKVLIDPTGTGVFDAENKKLRPVFDRSMRNNFHIGQVIIRFFKFMCRDFAGTPECCEVINLETERCLSAMTSSTKVKYIRTQILSKWPKDQHEKKLQEFCAQFYNYGFREIWDKYIEPLRGEILS